MGNPICYAELRTNDVDKAKAFYANLCDWKLQDLTVGKLQFTIAHVGDEGAPTGIVKSGDGRTYWIAFIEVDDIHTALARAQKLGAKIRQGAVHIPGFGWSGIIIDPTGAEIGLWKKGD